MSWQCRTAVSKRAQHRSRLPLQRHANVHRHVLAKQPVVDQRAIAANRSRLLQRQNPPRSRRSRQSHRLAHFIVRRPPVPYQVPQNRIVQFDPDPAARSSPPDRPVLSTILAASRYFHHVSFPFRCFITKFAYIGMLSRRKIPSQLGCSPGSALPLSTRPHRSQIKAALPGVETIVEFSPPKEQRS